MPELSARTRLLVLAPHPDDETLGAGLLIQQVLAAGGAVHLLLLTDGDDNPWPQRWLERRVWIGAADRQRWGRRRRGEVTRAVTRLGLPASSLQTLGWPDLGLTDMLRTQAASMIAALHDVLETFRPTLLALPALQDRHPDHGAAHVLCRLALAERDATPALLAYPVHADAQATDWPLQVEADADARVRKLAALAEHRSQTALSAGRMRHLAMRPERYVALDSAQSPSREPRLPWRPPAVLRPWLRLLLANPSGVRTWHWSQAPLTRDDDGGYRLALPLDAPCYAKLWLDWPSPWIFDHWGWCAL